MLDTQFRRCLLLATIWSVALPGAAFAQALKATAPIQLSPPSGSLIATRTPTLAAENAQGDYVSAVFLHRFEVYDAGRMTLESSGVVGQGQGTTQFSVSAPTCWSGSCSSCKCKRTTFSRPRALSGSA